MEGILVSLVFNRARSQQVARDLSSWRRERRGACSGSLTSSSLTPLKTEQHLIPTSLSSDIIDPQVLLNLCTLSTPYLSASFTCRSIRLSFSLVKSSALSSVLVRIYLLDDEGSPSCSSVLVKVWAGRWQGVRVESYPKQCNLCQGSKQTPTRAILFGCMERVPGRREHLETFLGSHAFHKDDPEKPIATSAPLDCSTNG